MRSALGKGLDALITDQPAPTPERQDASLEIRITRIRANPKQPRQVYVQSALEELARSIQQRGVIQPILVTPTSDGNYEIIAGERRWRAAQLAGLSMIPAVIKTASENERFEMALIENIQRQDLNPLELARGFDRLSREFQMTQEQIAAVIGKDRSVIANTLRLLNLPAAIQSALGEGTLSASHGRSIAALDDPAAQLALFKRITDENLSVRSVEQAVREHKEVAVRGHVRGTTAAAKAPEVKAVEEDLQRTLARKVELQTQPAGKSGQAAALTKGWLKLEFYSLDDLDHLIAQLKRISQPS